VLFRICVCFFGHICSPFMFASYAYKCKSFKMIYKEWSRLWRAWHKDVTCVRVRHTGLCLFCICVSAFFCFLLHMCRSFLLVSVHTLRSIVLAFFCMYARLFCLLLLLMNVKPLSSKVLQRVAACCSVLQRVAACFLCL